MSLIKACSLLYRAAAADQWWRVVLSTHACDGIVGNIGRSGDQRCLKSAIQQCCSLTAMKFKATIAAITHGQPGQGSLQETVLKVLQALHRLQRSERRTKGPASVVLKLTPEALAFCHKGGAEEGSQTWSHFQVKSLFKEYRIESKRDNKIDLEVPIANLLHVFTSCVNSDYATLRLANGMNDGRPVLNFDFALAGNAADHRVELEVPVRVIPEAEAELIREPALPEPEYQIDLPGSVSRLRNVLERMRQVGAQTVTVEAAKEAQPRVASPEGATNTREWSWLRLKAESDLVEVATTFPGLSLIMDGKGEKSPAGPIGLHLSLKRLAEVMAAVQGLGADAHIVCIIEQQALVLYALLPSGLGSVICYTPVITD